MSKCPQCGSEVEPNMKFCGECGARMPVMKKCPQCGAEMPETMKFCGACGYSFAGKPSASSAGLSLGDKNVVAGDVIGSKEDVHVAGNATFIKNEDETKKMVECHVCGKHLPITGAFTCPECHEITCAECYDKEHGLCVSCVESADARKTETYRACLVKVYEDGRVEMSERRELEALQKELGLSAAEAAELEKPFKSGRQAGDELGSFEKMYCEQALESLLGAGDVEAALKTIEPVHAKHPHDETVLGVYLPALALKDAKAAQKTMDSLGVDTESIALTRIDLALREKDLVAAEARIKSAVALWPKSRSLKVRELLCHYMAYMKFHKADALDAALTILKGLPKPTTKLENSYDFYVKSLLAVDLPAGFSSEERADLVKKGLHAALTNGLLFGIQPVLVDDLVKRCTKELETENAKLNLSPEELRVLKTAAAKHEPGAAYVYGTYACATGNAKERKNGLELIRLSAEAGNAAAQFAMGNHETSNRETLTQVSDWYRKSADQGYAPALAKVAALEKQIKSSQNALAAKQAAEVQAKAAKQAAEEKAQKEKLAKAAYEAAAPLRDLLANGLVKIPDSELFIGTTQVTQALWQCIMGENPSHFKGEERPVESVSLEDCERFFNRLNSQHEVGKAKLKFRLPTLDEWRRVAIEEKIWVASGADCSYVKGLDGEWVEKGTLVANVRSGGKDSRVFAPYASCWHEGKEWREHAYYHGYMSYSACKSTAWCWENANRETHTVAQKNPNKLGLYDIFGNVAEWCSDGHCMGGGFLTALQDCCEVEKYERDAKSPAIGLRLVVYKI